MSRLTGDSTCAACFCQNPQEDHVDFDSHIDRGFYGEGIKVPIDEMIICETCLKSAAKLVDMVDRRDHEQELSDLKIKVDRLEREKQQAQVYADNLESAFESRPQKIHVDHRKKPRVLKTDKEPV